MCYFFRVRQIKTPRNKPSKPSTGQIILIISGMQENTSLLIFNSSIFYNSYLSKRCNREKSFTKNCIMIAQNWNFCSIWTVCLHVRHLSSSAERSPIFFHRSNSVTDRPLTRSSPPPTEGFLWAQPMFRTHGTSDGRMLKSKRWMEEDRFPSLNHELHYRLFFSSRSYFASSCPVLHFPKLQVKELTYLKMKIVPLFSCVNWVNNGFCNNMGYSLAQRYFLSHSIDFNGFSNIKLINLRQAYCGISCGLCTSAGVPIVPGVCTADANAKWEHFAYLDSGQRYLECISGINNRPFAVVPTGLPTDSATTLRTHKQRRLPTVARLARAFYIRIIPLRINLLWSNVGIFDQM